MDEKDNWKNSNINDLSPATCEDLKPLSVYSMMITCEKKTNLLPVATFSNPFINFKIEVLNNCQKKRQFNDSVPEGGYLTPAKRAFCSKDLSPDLRCFMDTSPARQDSLSPSDFTKPAHRTQSVCSERRETVSSQLHVECGSSIEPWISKMSVPHGLKSDEVLINHAPDFDCDVDDILCLNPFGTSGAGQPSENVESCKFQSRLAFEIKPVLNPPLVHRQNLERGNFEVEEDKEEHMKNMVLNVKDLEEDNGYSSVSYIKDHEMGKNLSELPLVTSSPKVRVDIFKEPGYESQPGRSSEQGSHKQAALSRQDISFTANDLCPVVYGPQLESIHSYLETLEGDVEDVWNIGPPKFESSLCQKVSDTCSTPSSNFSEKLQGDVIETIHEHQATLSLEEITSDTSYESTLPLVKVKSVVVGPLAHLHWQTSMDELDGSRGFQTARFARKPRSLISKREVDWEREKRLYVHSVTRHMNEKPHGDPAVVMELNNLMTHVADQTPGTYGRHWQHPSDLTCRNYKQRFGNVVAKMPLNQWQAKNCQTHRRFNKVPKIFERSQFT